jgi:hypothetical protein
MTAFNLYRHYRRCGLPRWPAIKKAIKKAFEP